MHLRKRRQDRYHYRRNNKHNAAIDLLDVYRQHAPEYGSKYAGQSPTRYGIDACTRFGGPNR